MKDTEHMTHDAKHHRTMWTRRSFLHTSAGAGLGAGWAGLKVIGSGVATAAGFLLPFLPLLAIAGGVVWVVVRRRRARVRRGGPGPEGGV